jgi:hypothetical protein
MKHLPLLGLVATLLVAAPVTSSAAIIAFDLVGTAGVGLLPGNEPGSITGGTGGEIGAGITFDDLTKFLTINVGWGSSQGFTDLSSAVNNSHLHGPTGSNNGLGFTQTAGVLAGLTRSGNLATGGTISQSVALNATNEAALFAGKLYINIHTVNNGGGEMRGFIVQAVPEPSRALLSALGFGLLISRRRRQV